MSNEAKENGVLNRNWSWFVLRGGLAIALGVLAVLFPVNTLFAFTMVFAAFALVDGLFSVMSGIKGATRKEERWWALILRGLVGTAVGVLFVLMPLVTTISYAIVSLGLLAVWSIFTGVFEVAAAVKLRKEIKGEWLLGLSGLLSILLGMAIPLVLTLYPAATILSLAWLIGVYALAAGVALLLQGLRLRRSSNVPKNSEQAGGSGSRAAAPA